ncbi:unnamed protein product [Prunus armeniaca]
MSYKLFNFQFLFSIHCHQLFWLNVSGGYEFWMPIKGLSSFTFQLLQSDFSILILSYIPYFLYYFWATVLWLGDFYPTVNVLIADLKPVYWGRILESCRPSLPARREATKALGQRL